MNNQIAKHGEGGQIREWHRKGRKALLQQWS